MMSSRPQALPMNSPVDTRLYSQEGILDSACPIFTQYLAVTPQRLKPVLPFLRISFDSSESQIDLEQFIEGALLEKHMKAISERFDQISLEAELFLRSNLEILTNLEQGLECLEDFLMNTGVPYRIMSDFWQDSEALDFEVLEVIVKVDIADYGEILKLWKIADEKIYETLSLTAKKKIVVLFKRL